MKVDRVIFCWDGNPMYDEFWNLYSPVWKNKFNVTPTLFFNGEKGMNWNQSTEHGDVFLIPKVSEVIVNPSLDWSVTWLLFWGASRFPSEVCMTCGIDQLMLTNFFLDHVSDVPDNKYVVGFADAYKNYTPQTLGYMFSPDKESPLLKRSPASYFPSSHHVAKGSLYKEIYKMEETWEEEVKKVFSYRNKYDHTNQNTFWGLDECYSSDLIFSYEKEETFHLSEFFYSFWHPSRIDRCGRNVNYNLNKLRSGEYSEYHSHRPYSEHKTFIDQLIRDFT